MNSKNSALKLNPVVFFPPVLFLVITIGFSLYDNDLFTQTALNARQWILENFAWLFSWSTSAFLIILFIVYFSPLAKIRIGGKNAQPILTKWRWFAITLCTTIATGILFWGTAEPLYHLHTPPTGLGFIAAGPEALEFSMSTMFMHWSFTPYGIYTLAALVFALSYYNLKQSFSIRALLYPLLGERVNGTFGNVLDIICLYALLAGMAASLGTGMMAMVGGLVSNLGLTSSNILLAFTGFVVVATFIISAGSGLQRGIRVLSDFNIKAFFVLAAFVFLAGPSIELIRMAGVGLSDYVSNFAPRSVNIATNIETEWQHSWTIFYWANWFAWAPISALFLGRLSVGYTVRQFIHYNLIFPSLFAIVWMMIFSGTALHFDALTDGSLFQILSEEGESSMMYEVFKLLPFGGWLSIITLFLIYISYVTAADSNISAMSAISTKGITPQNPEAPLYLKVTWGILLGVVAYVMVSSVGIEGIRILSVLGGFPALFLIILVSLGLLKMLLQFKQLENTN